MAANYTGIELAIITSLETSLAGKAVEWPNFTLQEKPDGLWLAVHNIRGDSDPATIGINGEDNHPGIVQIDFNVPNGKGTKALLEELDLIAALYTSGTDFTYSGQTARVLATSASPGRVVDGYYRVSLSITYYARTTRN